MPRLGAARITAVRAFFVRGEQFDFQPRVRRIAQAILDPGKVRGDRLFVSREDVDDVLLEAWMAVDEAVARPAS